MTIATLPAGTSGYADTSVVDGTEYDYTVTAIMPFWSVLRPERRRPRADAGIAAHGRRRVRLTPREALTSLGRTTRR